MEKIRVAFFAELLIRNHDGSTRTMFQLLERIDYSRFEFLFISATKTNNILHSPNHRVGSVTIPFNNNYQVALPFLSRKKLLKLLEGFKPDVIHIATPSMLGHFGVTYAKQHAIPVITIYHTHFVSYVDYYLRKLPVFIKPLKNRLVKVEREFYNKCDVIYVPSESMLSKLISYGIEAGRLKIWKRGMDNSLFNPSKKDQSWIKQVTGNDRKNVLFASRLVWEKNLQTLIDVYRLAKERQLPYNFIVAGDGQARSACERQMKGAFFTGTLTHSKLATLYASSDVFLFPSVSETYGNVVAEAMACGLPCVIADGGGSQDFIRHGENGFKCDPFDAEAYLQYIKIVLEDQALAKQFSEESIMAVKHLNWDLLAGTYFGELALLSNKNTTAVNA